MLNKKTFVSLTVAAGLSVVLVGCNVSEKQVEVNPVISEQVAESTSSVLQEVKEQANSISNPVDKSTMSQEEIDKVVIDYYESLSVSLTNLWQDIKEKGPDAINEVTTFLKEIVINSVDFKNGAISINGVYYSDLSVEGKKIVDGLVGGISTIITMINPDLSEDLQALFGEDIINSATDAKDSVVQLGSDILGWVGEGINNAAEEWRKER